MQRLRRDVSSVRPRQSTGFDKEALKVRGVFKWFEDRSGQPGGEVNGAFNAVVKDDMNAVAATVFGADYGWKSIHEKPQSRGAILSSGFPSVILAQLASKSPRREVAHSSISRRAVRDFRTPARILPSKVKVACCPWYSA